MSRLVRCNRCAAEQEMPEKEVDFMRRGDALTDPVMSTWSRLTVTQRAASQAVQGYREIFDLCQDCHEILVEQFLKGATVAPITQPLAQTVLPHQPMTDCQLIWHPGKGRFLCYHEDAELYHALVTDQAQNVAEGVPPQAVQEAVDRMVSDVQTAGYAHSYVQRCTPACSEQHTYQPGCQLAGSEKPYGHDDQDLGIPPQRGWAGDPEND